MPRFDAVGFAVKHGCVMDCYGVSFTFPVTMAFLGVPFCATHPVHQRTSFQRVWLRGPRPFWPLRMYHSQRLCQCSWQAAGERMVCLWERMKPKTPTPTPTQTNPHTNALRRPSSWTARASWVHHSRCGGPRMPSRRAPGRASETLGTEAEAYGLGKKHTVSQTLMNTRYFIQSVFSFFKRFSLFAAPTEDLSSRCITELWQS